MHHSRRHAGFSLVELSIVLVILGLLVGGILAGQQLIHSAEMRAQMKQLESYKTAVNTFRMKYDGLPGDIDNATQVFLASEWPGIVNGNGNEKINDASGTYVKHNGEVSQFWMQLGASKLIEGTFDTSQDVDKGFPKNAIGRNGMVAVYDAISQRDNVFYIGVTKASSNNIRGAASFRPEEAWQMDVKMDDGHPYFGNLQARGSSGAAFNNTPDYFETARLESPHGNLFASAVLDMLISSAEAATVAQQDKACVLQSSSGTADEKMRDAKYAISSDGVNCQLSLLME